MKPGPQLAAAVTLAALGAVAFAQSRPISEGGHRMEIRLERLDGSTWKTIDPGLVLEQGNRVRFRFRADFDGFLYVMNQSSSGKYEQLFPREDTGDDNRISAGKEYTVPATSSAFRIAGPPGYETVYWLVTPARLTDAPPRPQTPAANQPARPITLLPRCDDTMLQARGECIDNSAGPKLVPGDVELPQNLSGAGKLNPRDLIFLRQQDTAVISSPGTLTGPVLYEFRVAHK
jgi:hypothetical protein